MNSYFVLFALLCFYEISSTQSFVFFNGGCMPISRFCPLRCPNGYQKDGNGCDTCHCASIHQTLSPTQATGQLVYQLHSIQNPCVATFSMCPLRCQSFLKGPSGCEICQCTAVQVTNTPTVAAMSTKAAMVTPTPPSTTKSDCDIAAQICNDRCNGHYLSDPKDCKFCVCRSQIQGV